MNTFNASSYGFLPFAKRDKVELELSLKDQLIERLERRFKEHQASLRFITVGSLAMASVSYTHLTLPTICSV